jgi:hypothetical protein
VLHVRETAAAADPATPWAEQIMTVASDGNFEARLRDVTRDVQYYVTGGDATSETFTATVLHKPAVARFHVRCVYPAYTNLPPREFDSGDGSIEASAGSEVALLIEATEPLDVATMTIGAESVPMTIAERRPNLARATFTIRDNRRYTIRMASQAGASGAFRGGTIRSIPDRPPVVRILELAADARDASEREVMPVTFQAGDDYGLARLDAEIELRRSGGGLTRLSSAVPIVRSAKQQQGVFSLEMAALDAKPGDQIELRFRAEDRAGQFDLSSPLQLRVVAGGGSAPATVIAQPSAASVPTTQRTAEPGVPLNPPGFEDALRAYFDAVRNSPRH